MLLKICTELPREMQGVLACCNPIPPLVKQNLHAIHMIMLKAREQPLTVIKQETPKEVKSQMSSMIVQDLAEQPLKCPLDLGRVPQDSSVTSSSSFILKNASSIGVFGAKDKPKNSDKRQEDTFSAPYKRYQMLLPYLKHLEDKKDDESNNSHVARLKSIREHFDALTAMTAEEYTEEKDAEEEDEEEEVKEEEEVIENVKNDPVRPLRQTVTNAERKMKRKRKPDKDESKISPAPAACSNAPANEEQDFSQFSKKKKMTTMSDKVFNPWKNYKKDSSKGAAKNRQKFKSRNQSYSYKKWRE